MTNIEFIDYIKTQGAYQQLLEQYNPYMIYLGGSRANGSCTEDSDWDLIVITKEQYVDLSGCINIHINNDKDLPAHALIVSIEHLVGMLTDAIDYCSNLHIIMFFMSGYQAYINYSLFNDNQMNEFFNFLNLHKNTITKICLFNFVNRLKIQIHTIASTGVTNLSTKVYYNLLTAFDILYNTDSSELIYLLRTHSILSSERKKELQNKMERLYKFLINYKEKDYDNIKNLLEVFKYGWKNRTIR